MKTKKILATVTVFIFILLAADCIASERLAVAVPTANIRSGPGISYDLLWQVERYYPLVLITKEKGWYLCADYAGDRGWVHKELVDTLQSVVTISNNINIRSGPGLDHPPVFVVEEGVPFRVIGTESNWLHVQHADGDTGWIRNDMVW